MSPRKSAKARGEPIVTTTADRNRGLTGPLATSGVDMAALRCPTCGKSFERAETTAMPFCSERCRLIDLGRWADERFSVPVESEVEPDEELSPGDRTPSDSE